MNPDPLVAEVCLVMMDLLDQRVSLETGEFLDHLGLKVDKETLELLVSQE